VRGSVYALDDRCWAELANFDPVHKSADPDRAPESLSKSPPSHGPKSAPAAPIRSPSPRRWPGAPEGWSAGSPCSTTRRRRRERRLRPVRERRPISGRAPAIRTARVCQFPSTNLDAFAQTRARAANKANWHRPSTLRRRRERRAPVRERRPNVTDFPEVSSPCA